MSNMTRFTVHMPDTCTHIHADRPALSY